jgi:hypothetical protein
MARQEAMRQLDAFAAAVQADGSAEGRAIAVGVQAFRPLVAQLVRSIDQYVAADGTHYALMAVQANTLLAVVEKARGKGLTLQSVDAATFEAQFDKVAHVEAVPPAIVADAERSWSDTVPKQAMDKILRARGPEPSWVKGAQGASLPGSVYICGRGHGSSVEAAVGAGAGALTRLWTTQATRAAADVQAAAPKVGLSQVPGGDADAAARAALERVQPLLQGELVWTDKKGRVTAATCVGRVKARIQLAAALKGFDGQLATGLAATAAAAADSAEKQAGLARALPLLQQREAVAAVLRSINVQGVGQAGPVALSDLAAAARPVPPPPRLAVQVQGPYALGVGNALVEGLRGHGVQPALAAVMAEPQLRLTAGVALPDDAASRRQGGKDGLTAVGTLNVSLQDVRTKAELWHASFRATGSATTNVFDAERAAIRQLGEQALREAIKALEHLHS